MLELPSIFSDGMILQWGTDIRIWGLGDPNAEVVVQFLDKSYSARADQAGGWRASLDPAEPGGPYSLRVSRVDGSEGILIEDVYVGDVWLCSGQSNMQIPMSRLKDDYPEEFELSPFPRIRQFMLPCVCDFSGPRSDVPRARWAQASAACLGNFSGVGWFFARYEQQRRPIPVGLVVAANGGAPIEAFMGRDALAEFPDRIAEAERYADLCFREGAARRSARATKKWDDAAQAKDRGLAEEWSRPRAEDRSWREIRLPGRFDEEEELQGFCGVIWLRRTFVAPDGFGAGGCRVWLGTIADADRVFINGVEVGGTGYRYPPRKYSIPAGLVREGTNHIAIRVVCNGGDGCITRGKPFRLLPGADAKAAEPIDLRGTWKYAIGTRTSPRPADLFLQWVPTGLFNGMIAPLLPYSMKGVLWYQGETNTDKPEEYSRLFESMVLEWRSVSGRDGLPFLFVQLPVLGAPTANDESSTWALMREAQRSALRLPATGMAVALDVGEWNDLHPLNKKEVGRRLALAAEALLHGEANGSPGPALAGAERRGGSLRLRFEKVGSGLEARDCAADRADGTVFVSVVGDDGRATRLPAAIEAPDRLRVDLSGVEAPAMVLYAWADNPADRQLYNGDGLPALPFRMVIPPG